MRQQSAFIFLPHIFLPFSHFSGSAIRIPRSAFRVILHFSFAPPSTINNQLSTNYFSAPYFSASFPVFQFLLSAFPISAFQRSVVSSQ
jgi:hypothetical protein